MTLCCVVCMLSACSIEGVACRIVYVQNLFVSKKISRKSWKNLFICVFTRLDEESNLMARTAAYTLVQFVYEHMAAEDVKSHILGPAGGAQVSCPRVHPCVPYSMPCPVRFCFAFHACHAVVMQSHICVHSGWQNQINCDDGMPHRLIQCTHTCVRLG